MVSATVYTTRVCPYCVAAKQLLDHLGVNYQEVDVGTDWELRDRVMRKAGQRTVPQIWIGKRHIGGFDELSKLHHSGALAQLINEAGDSEGLGHLSENTEDHS